MQRLLAQRREKRDERERFHLQGINVCYPGISSPPENSKAHTILEHFTSDDTYTDESGEKVSRPAIYSSLQFLAALNQVYDLNVIYSEELPVETEKVLQKVFSRIHYSRSSTTATVGTDDLCLKARPDNSKDPFELKIYKHADDENYPEDFLHELFVSFYYGNRLRKIIPNFQLCYAGIKALAVEREGRCLKEDSCPCDTTQTIDYLVLEKLEGESMSNLLDKCSLDEALSWIAQIVLSLEMGAIHFGFTHYNLHPDNIVIVPVAIPDNLAGDNNGAIRIKYWHRNQILILETTSVAVIKNFETSHVKHRYTESDAQSDFSSDSGEELKMLINQSEHFGIIGYESLGIFHNETRPFYDLYKILMWILYFTRKSNPKVYGELRRLSKFFGFSYERNLNRALDEESKLGFLYSTEISNKERSRSLAEFLAFMFLEFPRLNRILVGSRAYDISNDQKILRCDLFCPLNKYEIRQSITSDKNGIDDNILSFLGVRGCIERYRGLTKRAEELERLSSLFCDVSVADQSPLLCKSSSIEARDAKNELTGFLTLVKSHGKGLYKAARKQLEEDIVAVNAMIKINNGDINLFKEAKIMKVDLGEGFALERIERDRRLIQGKLVCLVRDLSALNEYGSEFQLAPPILKIEVDAIDPMPDQDEL